MGALVDLLNCKRSRDPILWVQDAVHLLMHSMATAENGCKGWYKAIDQVVSLLAILYQTSSKRMRGLDMEGDRHFVEGLGCSGRRPCPCSQLMYMKRKPVDGGWD